MKKAIKYLLLVLSITITSCQNPEKEAMKVVDNFFNEVKDHGADKYQGSLKKSREALNYSFVSTEMENLIRNNFIGIPDGTYKLTTIKNQDNTYLVTSIGQAKNLFGGIHEAKMDFTVSKINSEWKIIDAYDLIGLNLNFQVEDTQRDTYWDIKKANILHQIRDSLKLEKLIRAIKIILEMRLKAIYDLLIIQIMT